MAVFSTICLSTMGLGIWQVKRYFWKVDLIETIKHASHAAPVVLDAARMRSSSTMNDLEGKVALVTGRFDHNNEIYLGPRSAPTSLLGYAAQGMATNPQGYYVITPFVMDDGNNTETVIFVNRGWIPKDDKSCDRPVGSVTISCVITNEEKAGTFAPLNDKKNKTLLWLERRAIVEATNSKIEGYTPILVECVSSDDEKKKQVVSTNEVRTFPFIKHLSDFQDQYVTPMTHATYAVTWFSLAIAGFMMTYSMFKGKRRIRRGR